MPNKYYEKGRKKEYAIIKSLKAEGYEIAQRSAGSRSPIDLFAIHKLQRLIKFIQVKPNNHSDYQTAKLNKELGWLNNVFRVEFKVC